MVRHPVPVGRHVPVGRPGPCHRFEATRVTVPAPAATRVLGNSQRRAGIAARASRGPAARAGAPDRTEALIPGLVQIAGAADSTGTVPRTCAARGLAGTAPRARAARLTGLAKLAGIPFPATRTGTGTGTGTRGRTRTRGRSRTAGPARAVRCSGAARCR